MSERSRLSESSAFGGETFWLGGKIVLITGGARGIGRAITLELARSGADIAFTYRSSAQLAESLASEIKAMGRRVIPIEADATSMKSAVEVIEKVVAEFKRLDVLVNNAGITKDNLLLRMQEEDWDSVIQTNLKSVFNYTKAAARTMMGQRYGKIINLSSVVGIKGNAGQSNYAASKAGIIGFTKSIAKELASRNILVNAVAPGYIDTDMTAALTEEQRKAVIDTIPLKRVAKPEEVAKVVRFLASPDSDYITGQVISVDGGMSV
ncbi:MAG: 3-oxoacyl-[acyl-carrier-protein] reductase [Bacteroidetes bacterium]|nr:3-oxoacyl-[acyl-carrier-protein] reductase [Bacteroidota bacterium]MCL5737958.1 3-oxoacyl-[acyl-carrier-protein] reductase [Bacteroidota bacterium]